ncbi:chloride conductance regulatory protein ICln-like [Herrania umbratica]|uniref:Chloride conductance regulatory protein ICln-like n=1 Tax=Herrania umbratica TaxID=108875 RepID=A0A6J0ZNK8_9ROSI|nr:chloride conductance regulatory protein ICln-like [Herrania umbratica]
MVIRLRQFMARAGNGGREPVLDSDKGEELVHVQPSSPHRTRQVVWASDADSAKWQSRWFQGIQRPALLSLQVADQRFEGAEDMEQVSDTVSSHHHQ